MHCCNDYLDTTTIGIIILVVVVNEFHYKNQIATTIEIQRY